MLYTLQIKMKTTAIQMQAYVHVMMKNECYIHFILRICFLESHELVCRISIIADLIS